MQAGVSWPNAMAIDDYVGLLWRKYRKRFLTNRDRTKIPPSLLQRFAGQGLRLLVATEPYCDDSAQFIPVVWRLALELDDVEVRVLRQSEHPDLAGRYLADAGHPAIPVFILLNERGDELGALIERPQRATAEMTDETRRFQDAHPELPGIRRTLDRMPEETRAQLKQHIASWREGQQERWANYLLEDLAEIASE